MGTSMAAKTGAKILRFILSALIEFQPSYSVGYELA